MAPYDKKEENHNPGKENMGDHVLILYNDDVNTFDDVINALITICQHDSTQAEQCTIIAHYNGSCEIKRGLYPDLVHLRQKLEEQSLRVRIHQLIVP
ncbi:ATP-dependent Clp protease adaptor ClpS [Thermophagus sp. OGC60D27]|uniref:ATP-dependent Clp protease adaptor ClpS n=1 Tax=Thermophagus sp. OGC60D27 TaxID=3458415 RepID=UPI0040383291